METLLRMENITKSFPGIRALDNVSLEVNAGEVLAIVGENGAGKSTLMKVLSGAHRKDAGRIYLRGKETEIPSPLAAQKMGISIIYQEFNLTRNQSVAANIFMVREPLLPGIGGWLRLVDRSRMEWNAQALLERINARIPARTIVGDLPVAQRQMVEIAKALSVDAQIIIMDEPTATLGPGEVETLFQTVRSLKERGIAIIFIAHRLDEVFAIADRIAVLRDGRLVGVAPAPELTRDTVVRMMVGRQLSEFIHKEKVDIGAPLLEVRNFSHKGKLEGLSFTLHHGEILGFTGLVGAGRTEAARAVFGADSRDGGEIFMEGKPVRIRRPEDAVACGIGLVPEDRSLQGLVLKLSIFDNIAMASLRRYSRAGLMSRKKMMRTADELSRRMSIRMLNMKQKVMYLSGGNQQKVVLAKWLSAEPRVLIMDEPTRGIDVGAKEEVYTLIGSLAKAGMGIILISSELPEILGLSDRIVVMHEGRMAVVLDRAQATQELIMTYASGEKSGPRE
jgi:ribose transport system ATP-binding protein